ncbi:hypothetical protein AB1Y20_005587 [Prymnesium parvum]|uniref:BSD domain-containing protein n=1 Tax=Prymnesium parvum TaxID=97485 RepID=A0AB34J668_PRYPA
MGQDHSRHFKGEEDADGVSLWEGVPPEILWLVHSQVRLLLHNHSAALLHRPEQLQNADEQEQEAREGQLQPHEARLAHSALRDRVLMPQLQKVLDRIVPAHLNEAQFWDNFFSHVDVIKVRLVTDFLCAQDSYQAELKRKHAEWIRLFDSMEPEMQTDLRRASERIAARQQLPAPSAAELQLGIDTRRTPRWSVDGESWLEYVEDGPYEVAKVLRKELRKRAIASGAVPLESEPARDPLLSSPLHDAGVSPRSRVAAPAALPAASKPAEEWVEATFTPATAFPTLTDVAEERSGEVVD